MYKIIIENRAVREIKKFDNRLKERVYEAIENIKCNPYSHSNIKKLKGEFEGKYRYRIGDVRIIYYISELEKIIYLEAIGFRGNIYK